MDAIEQLAGRGIFRERDLTKFNLSHNWLHEAQFMGLVSRRGCGVWGHPKYVPTRSEFVQIRCPKAVFWGPSALWLLGTKQDEPAELWVAIANQSRPPRNLDRSTVVVRTRHLDEDVITHTPANRRVALRAHSPQRAAADVAQFDLQRMIDRATTRQSVALPAPSLSAR